MKNNVRNKLTKIDCYFSNSSFYILKIIENMKTLKMI